jgi:hypothetical protein
VTTWRPAPQAPAATDLGGPARLRGLLTGGAVVAAATVLVGVVDPNQPGHYPLCPFRALTGLACPGCGGLRAVHALTHGHLAEAFGHNPLVVLLLPAVVLTWVLAVRRALRGRVLAWRPTPVHLSAAAAVVLAFTVLRNLPGVDLLGP